MPDTVHQYTLYCNDCEAWKYTWGTSAPTTCPTNTSHSIDSESIAVFDTISRDEVIPTAPKNEYALQPLGRFKYRFLASAYTKEITLSNKDGTTFDYTPTDLSFDDEAYITQDYNTKWTMIDSVDTENHTVTVTEDVLANGTALLCNPYHIDYTLPIVGELDAQEYFYLWGVFFKALAQGDDDFIRFQICDTYNIMEYGAMYPLVEYDEIWVEIVSDVKKFVSPDGSPAPLLESFTLRANYYTSETSSTYIYGKGDYMIFDK